MAAPRNYCVRCYQEGRLTEIPVGRMGCANCAAAHAAESERITAELDTLDTPAKQIEFLLHELRKRKTVLPGGKMHTTRDPGPARGRRAKNIERILKRGKAKLARARAAGVDLTVLAPDSPIRKRTEAHWNRLLKYGIPVPGQSIRGTAGRRAIQAKRTAVVRAEQHRQLALGLKAQGISRRAAAAQLQVSEKTISRYWNDR